MADRRSTQLCPRYQAATDLIGKRWTPLILQVLMEGPLRFSELSAQLEVVGDRMLSERLKELEKEGLVERKVLDLAPVGVEYRLTAKGQALDAALRAIGKWAEEWIELPAEPKRARGR